MPDEIRCRRCTMTFKVTDDYPKSERVKCPECFRWFRHGQAKRGDLPAAPIHVSIDTNDLPGWGY